MENYLIINKKTLIQILVAQGLKTPGVLDIIIDKEDINLKNLEINITAIIDFSITNVMWIALELQKSLYSKVISLTDRNTATINIQLVLKDEEKNE